MAKPKAPNTARPRPEGDKAKRPGPHTARPRPQADTARREPDGTKGGR